jgi:hypothetical protein
MEQINGTNQRLNPGYVQAVVNSAAKSIGKNARVLISNDDRIVEQSSNEPAVSTTAAKTGPVIRSPKDFLEEFGSVMVKLYGKEGVGNTFKTIFNFIKKIATKMGGWDKIIDLVLLLPLPKNVKIVLEVLKKVLPLLNLTQKNQVGDLLKSALTVDDETNSPEELLQKMTESLLGTKTSSSSSIKTDDLPDVPDESLDTASLVADSSMSLEDKVMAVLMKLAETQEKEILDQANKLENSPKESRDKLMIELQIKMQKLTQTYSTLSNTLKAFHETALNSIHNIR